MAALKFTAAEMERFHDRFWAKVDVGRPDECWPWKAFTRRGYGIFQIGPRPHGAHRIAHLLSGGAIEDGKEIRHSCDNPGCCNPRHLSTGTHAENIRDIYDRRRGNGQLLTNEMVSEARHLYLVCGVKQRDIAARFGVTKGAISSAIRGKNWANLGTVDDGVLVAAARRTKAPRQGEASGTAKLTEADVLAIRAEAALGVAQVELSRKFKISPMVISNIVRRNAWRHI